MTFSVNLLFRQLNIYKKSWCWQNTRTVISKHKSISTFCSRHCHISKKCRILAPANQTTLAVTRTAFRGISRQPMGSPIGWSTVIICIALGSVVVLSMKHFKRKKEKELDRETVLSYGKPALGGDFELLNQDGILVSNKDFLGQWILIYFGFTHCPDICPEELEKMGHVVDIINRTKSVPDLQPVFISIDPERDTPAAVKAYIAVSYALIYSVWVLKCVDYMWPSVKTPSQRGEES